MEAKRIALMPSCALTDCDRRDTAQPYSASYLAGLKEPKRLRSRVQALARG